MSRGLKFRIKVVKGLYYPYSENKGADQLCSYCAADLRLCFRICKKPGFLTTRLIYLKFQASFCVYRLVCVSHSGEPHRQTTNHWSQDHKTFFMLNSAEHETQPTHKFQNGLNGIFRFKSSKPIFYSANKCLNVNF